MLIIGERQLTVVLTEYARHYNDHRPHRALAPQPPNPPPHATEQTTTNIHPRSILGGLINEYAQAA
jgi:putative transposase